VGRNKTALPAGAVLTVMSSRKSLVAFPLPHRRVSQVPRRIFTCALSPTTPESPVMPFSRYSITGGRLHRLWQAGRLSFASRGRIGFTCVTARRFALRGFDSADCSRCSLAQLHVERLIHMVDSFHSTRFARSHWHTEAAKDGFFSGRLRSIFGSFFQGAMRDWRRGSDTPCQEPRVTTIPQASPRAARTRVLQ
jgi:hypothetical protein